MASKHSHITELGTRLRERRRSLGLTQKELARQMGYDHSRVSRMERGEQAPTRGYLEQFLQVAALKGDPAEELWQLFRQARFPEPDAPLPPADSPVFTFAALRGRHLPPHPYYALRAQEKVLAQIMRRLEAPGETYAVCLCGNGGAGKTTLALEAAGRLLARGYYADALWLSARRLHTFPTRAVQEIMEPLEWENILDTLAWQLGLNEAALQPPPEKAETLAAHFRGQAFLVILDNLEVTSDPRGLVQRLLHLLGRSRLLITTRDRTLAELGLVWMIPVEGLSKRDAATFLQTESERVGLRLSRSALNELRRAHSPTAGMPFALKRVISQVQEHGLEDALDILRHIPSQEAADFYAYLFARDWQDLDGDARRLWIFLGQTIPQAIAAGLLPAFQLTRGDWKAALKQLVLHGLVETRGNGERQRVSLHPLAQEFIRQLPLLAPLDEQAEAFHREGCYAAAAQGWLELVKTQRAVLMDQAQRSALMIAVGECLRLGWHDQIAAMWDPVSTALGELGLRNAYERFERMALAAAEARGDRAMQADIFSELAWIEIERNRPEAARAHVRRALEIYSALNDRCGLIVALRYLATIQMQERAFDAARAEFGVVLALIRRFRRNADAQLEAGLFSQEVAARASLGVVLMELGEFDAAEQEFDFATQHAAARGAMSRAMNLFNYGQLRLKQGDPGHARRKFTECLEYARANNLHRVAADALFMLATIAQQEGNAFLAREQAEQARRLYHRLGASADEKRAQDLFKDWEGRA